MAEKSLAAKGVSIEQLGKLDLRLGMKGVPDVPQFFRLLAGRRDKGGMAVPENRPAKTGEQIEVLLPVGIP